MIHKINFTSGFCTFWLYLTLTQVCHAVSNNVPSGVSLSNITEIALNRSTVQHDGTSNLTEKIPFQFEKNAFKYVGTIDTSQSFAREEYRTVTSALAACWQQLTRFYPADGTTAIPPGTNVVFYLDDWQFRFLWGARGSPMPIWTRDILDQAALNLKEYFESGEGKAQNRHGMKVATRYSTQQSLWSLDISQPNSAEFRVASGPLRLLGNVYSRDPLASNVCSALIDAAIQWARQFKQSQRIPVKTWQKFEANDVSLRIYVGSLWGKAASPINYRELAKLLEVFRNHLTSPGQPGWVGALIFFGPVSKPSSGVFELAPGMLPNEANTAGVQQINAYA